MNMFQMKEQDKAPEEQLKQSEWKQAIYLKKIHSNDKKDDPRPQKNNGGTDQEDTRNA